MDKNDSDVWVFSPIFLDCKEPWSKFLPDILDEEPSSVVTAVTLGSIDKYVVYEERQGLFKFDALTQKPEGEKYEMSVMLTDKEGATTTYNIPVSITCSIEEVV